MGLKKLAAVALAVVLSLAVVGCGSSNKNDEASDTEAAGQAEKQSDGSSTTTAPSDDDSSSSDSSDLAKTLDKLNNGELGDCLSTSMAYASLVLAPLGFTGGATEEQIDEFEKNTEELEAKIPSELKDDFETVAAAFREYGETLKGLDFGDMLNPDTQQKLEEAGNKIEEPEVEAASERIQTYFDESCSS